jgi:hypothetical protein
MARRAMLVLTEAETCATAGNMMYARWHLSEILRNLPNSAADIGKRPTGYLEQRHCW